MRYYRSVATRNSQLFTRKNHSCSRYVKQQHHPDLERPHTAFFFHVFALYRTKSDRNVLRRMLLKPKKNNRTEYSYRLPGTDLKNKIFRCKIKSNNPHVHTYDIIWVRVLWISTHPLTKSSTRGHTASLFCFTQRTTMMYVPFEYAWKIPGIIRVAK